MKLNIIFIHLLAASWLAFAATNPAFATGKPLHGTTEGVLDEGQDATAESGDVQEDSKATPQEESVPIANNVSGNYLSSQFARNSGNIELAINELQRVHREDPGNMSVAMQLQGLMLVQGRVDEAVLLAGDIDKAGGKDPLTTLLLALHAIKQDHPNDASKVLDHAVDGGNSQLWLPLIQAWVDIQRHSLEKPVLADSISNDAGRAAPLINYHLALINSQGGFKDEAAKNFKAAIQDAKDPPIRVMKQLLRFYDQNDAPETLTPIVKTYREANPSIENDGNTPAINTARDGVAEILYTMGGIMFGAGVTNDAAIYLQLAVYIKPELSEAVVALGDTYSELQQYDRSNAMYLKVTPQNFLYSKAQLHIAVNYERMGKFKEAVAQLDKLAKDAPNTTEALVTKGDLLRIHAKYPEAVEAYSQALKRIPDMKGMYWPILFARGSCYEREGKWALAEKDLQAALELKPDQPDVMNYLGFGWLERGVHIDEARDMIAKAVKARPDDAQIVDSMGWALYMEGDYATSISYLEKAVELLPGDPTVNDHLGDAYWRLGRHNEARFQWQRSLSFSPEMKAIEQIHKKLKDGLPPSHMAQKSGPDAMTSKAESSVIQ